MDLYKLGPGQQQGGVVAQRADGLPDLAAGQVEVEVLPVDLHIGQLGEGHPDKGGAAFYRQPLLGALLLQGEPVQDGEKILGPDGLEQIIQRLDAVALVGEVGGGGEEDDGGGGVAAADLPGRADAVGPRKNDIQQIQGKPLLGRRVQQRAGAGKGLILHGRAALLPPAVQQGGQGAELLRLVVANGNIDGLHPPDNAVAVMSGRPQSAPTVEYQEGRNKSRRDAGAGRISGRKSCSSGRS